IDDEEDDGGDQRDLALDADAEPEDEQRREGELRRRIAADHERVEDRDEDWVAAQEKRQKHRGHAADQRPGRGLAKRVAGMAKKLAGPDLLAETRECEPGRAEKV